MLRTIKAIERRTERFSVSIDPVSYGDIMHLIAEVRKWEARADNLLREFNEIMDSEYSRDPKKMEDFDNDKDEEK